MLIDFRERGGEREKEKHLCEREHQSVAFLTCPDKELNPQPFSILDNTPTNWQGLLYLFFICNNGWMIFRGTWVVEKYENCSFKVTHRFNLLNGRRLVVEKQHGLLESGRFWNRAVLNLNLQLYILLIWRHWWSYIFSPNISFLLIGMRVIICSQKFLWKAERQCLESNNWQRTDST